MKIIYLAGKMSASYINDPNTLADKIKYDKEAFILAQIYAKKLWEIGFVVISPHLNSDSGKLKLEGFTWQDYLEADLEIISRCDAVYVLPNWRSSRGATKERDYAKRMGISVLSSLREAKRFLNAPPKKKVIEFIPLPKL